MQITVAPGKYIVAVSGGVDSVVLLHRLFGEPEVQLVVAHFDHGIRLDSAQDRRFVQELARYYELPFMFETAQLGPNASEALARQARYEFLRRAAKEQGARAILTAHHQDDLIETAVINMIRGTGRKGLSALGQIEDVKRPMLHVPKQEILQYATGQGLEWREDSTNQNDQYLRNHIRHNVLPRLSTSERQALLGHITEAETRNRVLDELFAEYLNEQTNNQLNRRQFIMLPHAVAREVMAAWLRANGLRDFNSNTLERAVWAGKTFHPGKQAAMLAGVRLQVNRGTLALTTPER